MLRPVRQLRRSVDVSRRTSQNSQAVLCVLQPSTVDGSAAAGAVAPADMASAQKTALNLPPLRPCLKSHPQRDAIGSVSEQDGSRCASGAELISVQAGKAILTARKANQENGEAMRSSTAVPPSIVDRPASSLSSSDLNLHQHFALPAAVQRLFSSNETAQLRLEARLEYNSGRRLQERRDVAHEEEEKRRLLVEDARHQFVALFNWERECLEALLRAKSEEALPFQLLEMRIQGRIQRDYAREDAELRQEGRAAWMEQVAKENAAATKTETGEVERRAASHRFRAALTFIVVRERNMRVSLEKEAAQHWDAFLTAEEASKAEAVQRALLRFLNTPEQLALAAVRERQERRQEKAVVRQRRLFQVQQDAFVKGCHHGASGTSVFEGNAVKKICGRCRVKWDEELGYYVSLDRNVKTHPPPPPRSANTEAKQADGAEARAIVETKTTPPSNKTLPALKSTAKR